MARNEPKYKIGFERKKDEKPKVTHRDRNRLTNKKIDKSLDSRFEKIGVNKK